MTSEVGFRQVPGEELIFPSHHVDVWRVELDSGEPAGEDGQRVLAADEVARASRFHFDRDRNRYVRCRLALRNLLGSYLQVLPGEIRFRYESRGKPEIDDALNPRSLRFNVAHSGGLALIAIGSGRTMGVDVERIRPMPDLLNIARRFFSAREVQAILTISEDKRTEAFFACWTRKEAFLKATGEGLSHPLGSFSVSVDPQAAAELWEVGGNEEPAGRWRLTDVIPDKGYRGALACDGEPGHVAQWIFDPLCIYRVNQTPQQSVSFPAKGPPQL